MPIQIPTYVNPQASITDPYYGNYSALAQQFLRTKHAPVQSPAQGIADVLGDVGEAYMDKREREKAQAQQTADNASIAQAIMAASNPMTNQQTQSMQAGNMQGSFPVAQSAFPGGQPPLQPGAGGDPTQAFTPAKPAFDNSQATAQQRAIAALSGVNPRVLPQALPAVMQAAQQNQGFSGVLKPGEGAFKDGKQIAGMPGAAHEPKTVTTAQGVFVLNDDKTLGPKLGDPNRETQEPLVQIPDPNDPTKAIYVPRSQAIGQHAFQTPRERNSKMQTYWGADGSFQQLDSNDPEDQKTIKEKGLVTAAPSDNERAAKGFLDRMQEAKGRLDKITTEGFDPSNLADNRKAGVPLAGNYLVSDNFQQYHQAAEDWVRAKLRKESGAVIGPQEMKDEIKTYFPQPGDSLETQKNKEKSRRQAERQMATGAGILGRSQLTTLDTSGGGNADLGALLDKYAPVKK
jgi:hypothetical protein